MIINITNRKSKVSDNVRERIESWLNDSQERCDIITSAQVTLDKSEQHDMVEATIHAAGKDIFAKAEADNLYMALDALADKIDRQLAKLRDKQQHKKGTHKLSETLMEMEEKAINDADLAAEYETETDEYIKANKEFAA